jgi:hypothetical protein
MKKEKKIQQRTELTILLEKDDLDDEGGSSGGRKLLLLSDISGFARLGNGLYFRYAARLSSTNS